MNVERLELMATMLTEVVLGTWKPKKKAVEKLYHDDTSVKMVTPTFNLNYWGTRSGDCGYSACACGHAGLDKRFIKLGLTMYDNTMFYNGLEDWRAISSFFDITRSTAYALFMREGNNNTQSDVIKRILTLIEVGEDQLSSRIYGA